MAKTIEIGEQISLTQLAELLSLPVSALITELFKNGVMATVNESIDFDTAQILLGELELDEEYELKKKDNEPVPQRERREASDKATARPPVVAMMGHVDHGKTSLLDAIRESDTVKGEAGGITQHLSAYQITHNKRLITFLDTPGHEAFAALREHGARLTDLVILVVAADEGIKPQTQEAIRFATNAGVKIIVAANKIDKPNADINRLKQQLAENNLLTEDWGGDTIVLPVSAKTKEGVPELLDMVLLVADVEELKADSDGPAEGIVIEAHMEKGRGRVAIAMVEQGTLNEGDTLVVGSTYGRIRNLENTNGQPIKSAGPATPVIITGLKDLPDFADEFSVAKNEKEAKDKAAALAIAKKNSSSSSAATSGSELLKQINRSQQLQELNIILKADVQGSLTSVIDSLKTLDTEEVAVKIVGSGVGIITESDVHQAATSAAIIYGFNVDLQQSIKRLAQRDKVSVRLYRVIYELIDDVKKEMEELLSPEIIEEKLGNLIVKGIFKTTKTEVICGGEVSTGKLAVPSMAKLYRDKELIADELEVTRLQRGPTEVSEVEEGEMCGLSFKSESRVDIKEGDRLELFKRETKQRTL